MSTPKKKPWYKRIIPTCGRTKESLATTQNAQSTSATTVSLNCGNCRKPATITSSQTAFVCSECHRVNRVKPVDQNGYRRVSIVTDIMLLEGPSKIGLTRTASTTFQTGENLQIDPSTLPRDSAGTAIIPQCTVCMDGPGDIVISPCCHGGICEPCAKHICKNLSVGGSHCPKCRNRIEKILRLCELHVDGRATGVVVDVPVEQIRNGPPKVPPPVGQNKAKQ